MAGTGIATGSGLTVKQWKDQAFQEYLSLLVLAKYMGTDENAMIQVSEELMKAKGDKVVFSLISALSGSGVQGDSTLEGNEEELLSYEQSVTIDLFRNAVKLNGKMSEKRYPWSIWEKAKPALNNWKSQFDEIRAFLKMGAIDDVLYAAASESQKDTWLANNNDRVIFGAATSNNSANDHSACLSNVDSTTDVLNTAHLSLCKRMAKMARPRIRPLKVPNGPSTEVYVYFAHPYTVRSLKADSAWSNAQQNGMPRGLDNPLFTGAIGMWDGIVVVETDKIAVLDDVGNGTSDVAQNFLCGAQAMLWALGGVEGDRLGFQEEAFDYKNKKGVAIESMYEVVKARFATGAAGVTKDHGVLTSYVSCVAD
jgi:N4-gp56 family major capsid protein